MNNFNKAIIMTSVSFLLTDVLCAADCYPEGNKSATACKEQVKKDYDECIREADQNLKDIKDDADNHIARGHYLYMKATGCRSQNDASKICAKCSEE